MEPAHIDWDHIDSRFVEDIFYEHLRAPKWFDFLAPNYLHSIDDDDAWFCKPECNHPKRPEDFLLLTPSTSSTHISLTDTNETPGVTEQNQRRKGYALPPSISNHQESENQNPNLATPRYHHAKSWRSVLTSTSSVKQKNQEAPRLKSTQSARNLFSGRDIFGHISEFCYELKRLATKVTEREDTGKSQAKESHQVSNVINQPYSAHGLDLKKERKPLLEVSKDKIIHESKNVKGSTFKENRRRKKRVDDVENFPVSLNVKTIENRGEEDRKKKRGDDAENTPIPLKLDITKNKGHERLLQIRTNPPSPQCFSENRTATLKASRAKASTEKGMVEEVKRKEEEEEKSRKSGEGKEGRGLDVLWFLKPCTLAN